MRMQSEQAIIIVLNILICSTYAHAGGVNEFYKDFLSALKNDRTSKLEALVRAKPNLAVKCLDVIHKKMQGGQDRQKTDTYAIVAQELEELIGLAKGKKNCSLAEKIYQRGLKALVLEEKLKKFARVVKLCPSHGAAYVNLGDINRKMGRFDDAVMNYEKALNIERNGSEALLGLGETFLNAGLYRRSLPYFERILAIDPQSTHAKKLLELAGGRIAQDNPKFLLSPEIVDRLGTEQENLMCMCPQFSKLQSRLRLHEVTFPISSAALSSRTKRQLDELAVSLKSDPLRSGRYIIEGHSDATGSKDYNQSLSLRRARAVKEYLVTTGGVPSSLLSTVGAGDSRAWTTNRTTAGRRANRRVEILSVRAGER